MNVQSWGVACLQRTWVLLSPSPTHLFISVLWNLLLFLVPGTELPTSLLPGRCLFHGAKSPAPNFFTINCKLCFSEFSELLDQMNQTWDEYWGGAPCVTHWPKTQTQAIQVLKCARGCLMDGAFNKTSGALSRELVLELNWWEHTQWVFVAEGCGVKFYVPGVKGDLQCENVVRETESELVRVNFSFYIFRMNIAKHCILTF